MWKVSLPYSTYNYYNNFRYFPNIYNMSGKEAEKEKYGSYFDYHKTARAQIFKRDQSKVTDMQSLVKLMRQGTLCLFLCLKL